MKKTMFVAVLLAATSWSWGDEVGDRGPKTVFTNQTLSASYVAGSTVLDLNSFDSATVEVDIGTAVTGRTARMKYQWSLDNSTWVDEMVLTIGTIASNEAPYTPASRRIDIPLDATTFPYIERVHRLARYFRVQVKADSATTATVAVKAIPMNNAN